MVIQKDILMFGQPCTLACDAQCHKAWGINTRPHLYRTHDGTWQAFETMQEAYDSCPDVDDNLLLADGELGIAPEDPGTAEGDEPKPRRPEERLNKWCARECERSRLFDPGEPIVLDDFTQRQYNKPPHTREERANTI